LAIVAKAAADALHLPEVFTRPERYEVLGRYVGPDIAPAPSVVRARKLATRRQQAAANLAAYVATIEPKPAKPLPPYAATDAFLSSYEWRRLRMLVLTERGARCECCGATARDGVRIHVDHIKPRRKFPELALEQLNLQVLCEVCNHGKGNWDQTDWRDLPTHKGVQ
jgi:5-methylcytosine-specific restriction endonuclease McrA